MSIRISELTAAGALAGGEQFELSRPSPTVTMTATTISAAASDDSLNDSGAGFVAAGFAEGDSVRVQGFTDGANSVFSARIDTLTAGKMALVGASLVDEAAGDSVTVTKWESRRAQIGSVATDPIFDAKGDLVAGTGSDTASKLAVGTNGQVLTADSGEATGLKWASAGGGLTNFTDAVSTSSPNASVPVVSLSATNAATEVDVALRPKGIGAISAHIADGTSAGGNKRGSISTDWQRIRSAASMVASGNASTIGGGRNNTASAADATVSGGDGNIASNSGATVGGGVGNSASAQESTIAGGNSCGASGSQSTVGGGSGNSASAQYATVPGGRSNVADGIASTAIGKGAKAMGITAAFVHGAQGVGTGMEQWMGLIVEGVSTDATEKRLTSDAGAASTVNQMLLGTSNTYFVKGMVVARQNTTGDSKAWEFTALIKRGASAAETSMVAAATVTPGAADAGASAWTLTVDADTTNGTLAVRAVGEAAKTIRWIGYLTAVQAGG